MSDVVVLRVTIPADDLARYGKLGAFDAAVARLRVEYLAAVERGNLPISLSATFGGEAKR